jgi:hypothetical protein
MTMSENLEGKPVWYWSSASNIAQVTFVRWCRMRMHTGGPDTNTVGTGAVVVDSLMLRKSSEDYGLPVNQRRLRPYWKLYRSSDDAKNYRNEVSRPACYDIPVESKVLKHHKVWVSAEVAMARHAVVRQLVDKFNQTFGYPVKDTHDTAKLAARLEEQFVVCGGQLQRLRVCKARCLEAVRTLNEVCK